MPAAARPKEIFEECIFWPQVAESHSKLFSSGYVPDIETLHSLTESELTSLLKSRNIAIPKQVDKFMLTTLLLQWQSCDAFRRIKACDLLKDDLLEDGTDYLRKWDVPDFHGFPNFDIRYYISVDEFRKAKDFPKRLKKLVERPSELPKNLDERDVEIHLLSIQREDAQNRLSITLDMQSENLHQLYWQNVKLTSDAMNGNVSDARNESSSSKNVKSESKGTRNAFQANRMDDSYVKVETRPRTAVQASPEDDSYVKIESKSPRKMVPVSPSNVHSSASVESPLTPQAKLGAEGNGKVPVVWKLKRSNMLNKWVEDYTHPIHMSYVKCDEVIRFTKYRTKGEAEEAYAKGEIGPFQILVVDDKNRDFPEGTSVIRFDYMALSDRYCGDWLHSPESELVKWGLSLTDEIINQTIPSIMAEHRGLQPVYVGLTIRPMERHHKRAYTFQVFMTSFTGSFAGKPARELETIMIQRLKEKWPISNDHDISNYPASESQEVWLYVLMGDAPHSSNRLNPGRGPRLMSGLQ